jgi:hypothetical protein
MKRHVTGQLEVPAEVAAATPATLELAADAVPLAERDLIEPQTTRVDLIFYEIDHSGPSYEARVFVGNGDATAETPREVEHGYVGSFTVFGHGGCYGEAGHCDIHQGTRDEYDVRPPHPLTPWTKTLIVPAEAIGLFTGEAIKLTVLPLAIDGDGELDIDFKRVRLAAYSD